MSRENGFDRNIGKEKVETTRVKFYCIFSDFSSAPCMDDLRKFPNRSFLN